MRRTFPNAGDGYDAAVSEGPGTRASLTTCARQDASARIVLLRRADRDMARERLYLSRQGIESHSAAIAYTAARMFRALF